MISEHILGWVVDNPGSIEEVAFRYPNKVVEGQRVEIISTVKNNTSSPKRAKLILLDARNNQEITSSEGGIGPFVTTDICVDCVVDPDKDYKAVVEEV